MNDVVPTGPGCSERDGKLWELGLDQRPEPAEEEVGHTELVDPFTLPGVPCLERVGRRGTVAFEHHYVVVVTGQQHGSAETHHSSAHDRDLHCYPFQVVVVATVLPLHRGSWRE